MRNLTLCAIGFAIGSLIVLLAGCSGSRPAYGPNDAEVNTFYEYDMRGGPWDCEAEDDGLDSLEVEAKYPN